MEPEAREKASRWSLASGPAVARLFHALYGLCMAIAWASLGVQVRVLMGSDGLEPLGAWVERLRSKGVEPLDMPMLFWAWIPGDGGLRALCWAGVALSLLAAAGVLSRPLFAIGAALYLSMSNGGGTFMSFQWDNLAVEAGLLAALLPREAASFWPHLMGRALLFKVFFESALAKLQSPIHDWTDGSAMSFYYETAPLPTWLGWYAHHLPAGWHHFESLWTLFFEGVVVFGVWGTRLGRRAALVCFSLFLVVDTLTANYGFFTYLTGALCVFLLSEDDVRWLGERGPLRRLPAITWPRLTLPERPGRWIGGAVVGAWLVVSAAAGLQRFGDVDLMPEIVKRADGLRVANVYHLFSAITRTRVEPEFQTFDGQTWTTHDLAYKPGDVSRPPPFVAPHQPRVDFRLWFYGLSYTRGTPGFVGALLGKMCTAPWSVSELFPGGLPGAPKAVRVQFWTYEFTTPAERAESGAWWRRSQPQATRAMPCLPDTPLKATITR